jgi:hypothetical protein
MSTEPSERARDVELLDVARELVLNINEALQGPRSVSKAIEATTRYSQTRTARLTPYGVSCKG